MHPNLVEEFRRLRDNAGDKREKLLRIAFKQSRLRKRLNIAAGVLALLSAASITALLGDFASARAMKILAALFSTASGFISLLVNTTFKDSELSELNLGAAGYLSLRERAHRIPLDPNKDDNQAFSSLVELQEAYADLDAKFQRYVVIESIASGGRSFKPPYSPSAGGPPMSPPPKYGYGPPTSRKAAWNEDDAWPEDTAPKDYEPD